MENGIQNAENQLQKKKERPLGSAATLLGILVGVLEMLYAFISALKGIVLVLDNFRNSADHAPISYIYLFVIAIADFTLGIYLLVFLTRGRILSSQKKSPFKILTLSLLGMHATAAFISLFRMCCFGFKASSVILLNEHIAGIILAVLAFLNGIRKTGRQRFSSS